MDAVLLKAYLYYMLYTVDKHGETICRFRIPENAGESFTDKELFGGEYYQPYNGTLYYADKESIHGYDYILYRKDFNSGKDEEGNDIVEEIAPNAEHINIYKDKIYFSINDTYLYSL